jgi:hypothetical protein
MYLCVVWVGGGRNGGVDWFDVCLSYTHAKTNKRTQVKPNELKALLCLLDWPADKARLFRSLVHTF